ncbi:MAG: hypothetical protein IV090_03345 [Candidatus Sericytochromatia bacterium]|nr:hypothetical protein [Candidatus Sericytochromatia bacterium]
MKPLKQNLFTKAGLVWLLLVIVLLSCTQQPLPVGPGGPNTGGKNPVQKGFSVKAASGLCFSSSPAYQNALLTNGSIPVDVNNSFSDGSPAYSPDPIFFSTNSSTYLTWYISEGSLYIGTFEAHAFSGPYGYHLYLSRSNDPIIKTGLLEVRDGYTFTANVLGSARYEFGSSAGNSYDLKGTLEFRFEAGQIHVTFDVNGDLLPQESGLGHSSGQVDVTGTASFGSGIPLVTCQYPEPDPSESPDRPCIDTWGPECACPAGQICKVLETTPDGPRYCEIRSVNRGEKRSCFYCDPGESIVFENDVPKRCSNAVQTGNQSAPFGILATNRQAIYEDLCTGAPIAP